METKTKTFDAIDMSRRLRREVSDLTVGMTREEELAFFNGPTQENRKQDRTTPSLLESSVVREDSQET